MSPLPRQGWLFLIEFLKWYFSKYWQVRTRPVFAQTVTNDPKIFLRFNTIQAGAINNNILQSRTGQGPRLEPHHTGLLNI